MSKLSPEQSAWSRNMQSQILQGIDAVTPTVAADCMGVDVSTISRWKDKDGRIASICDLMAVLGLKVVPMDMQCYNPAKVEILWALAKDNLTRSQQVDDFFHDDARLQIKEGTYKPRSKELV